MALIEMKKISTEVVTPSKFLKLMEKNPGNIRDARILPPQFGGSGFGNFVVTYRTPGFRATAEKRGGAKKRKAG